MIAGTERAVGVGTLAVDTATSSGDFVMARRNAAALAESLTDGRSTGMQNPCGHPFNTHQRRTIVKYPDRNWWTRPLKMAGALVLSCFAIGSLPAISRAAGASGQAQTVTSAPTSGVDGLIAHLHQEFMVTPAQEELFQKLANVMREDADNMSALAKKRSENAKTNTAVEDLQSYAEIAEAHAEGTKRMIPVFQALYESMSDAQKKAADIEFREHYASHHHHKH